jgi:hypothetical protein
MNRLLIVLSLFFVLVLVYQWQDYADPLIKRGGAADAIDLPAESGEAAVPTIRSAPLASFDEVVQRPLFIEGRRPPPEVEAPPEDEKPKLPPQVKTRPRLSLTAILIVDNQKQAVFRTVEKKQALQNVAVGEEIDGWVVSDIQSTQVKLTQGGAEEVFLLREYEKVPLPVIPDKAPVQKIEPKEAAANDAKNDAKNAAQPRKK